MKSASKQTNSAIWAKLTVLAFALFFTGKSFGQCSTPGSFIITNNLACNVEVWIEMADCTVPGSAFGWWVSIAAGGVYIFTIGASDNIDVILTNVGGTNIPTGSLNEYNPCNPTLTCLPGNSTGNSGPTGDPNCPTYNMLGGINNCDINP